MEYAARAADYADAVIAGDIVACELVQAACRRFIADIDRDDIYLSDQGDRWCRFLEKLPHVKGAWASRRETLRLSDWQVFCTVNIYGWRWVDTNLRRFREVYVEVPRKNGKTFWFAGLGLGHLTIDGEFGAEVYCGATTETQAWEVFRPARQICERFSAIRERFAIDVNAKSLVIPDNGSRFLPVIGNPGDGSSPSCAIADEYHEHKTSDLVDTMATGMGAREQPLLLIITTAGTDMGGPCYAKRADVINILRGAVTDDRVFGIIFGLDEDDRWDTLEAAKKANPNFGVSVNEDFILGQLEQARRSAAKQNAYRTKHLNQWVGARAAWMNMLAYQRQRRRELRLEEFRGCRAFAALDLASKVDVACCAILLEKPGGKLAAFVRHYLPEARITDGGFTRYKEWHAAGWITATPGEVIDFEFIERDLEQLKSDLELVDIAYDPFQATQFATRQIEKGYPMIEYGQTVRNMSEPMKTLHAWVIDRRIEFEHDPVLMWMFGNVVARVDAKDNIFPRKETAEAAIDGVVALIMATGRYLFNAPQINPYDSMDLDSVDMG